MPQNPSELDIYHLHYLLEGLSLDCFREKKKSNSARGRIKVERVVVYGLLGGTKLGIPFVGAHEGRIPKTPTRNHTVGSRTTSIASVNINIFVTSMIQFLRPFNK